MSFAGKRKGGFSLGAGASAGAGARGGAQAKAVVSKVKGKQRAVVQNEEDQDDDWDEEEDFDDGDEDDLNLEDEDDDYGVDAAADADGDDGADTDEEIEAAKAAVAKSSRTAKRKRRATSPGAFGATLQSLLGAGPGADEDDGAGSGGGSDDDEEDDAAGGDDERELDSIPTPLKKRPKKTHAGSVTTGATSYALGGSSSRPSAILSLAPHLRRTLTSQKLNAKAARLAIQQRKMREERAHITDVIGGWGPPGVLPTVDEEAWMSQLAAKKRQKERLEGGGAGAAALSRKHFMGGSAHADEADEDQRAWLEEGGSRAYERKLRKVAQRGIVKLFNAIRAAQMTSLDDVEEAAASGDTTVKKPAMPGGKEAALSNLSKTNFLDLIRSGGA